MDKTLRYAIYTGLFGVLFIPFIVSGDFFFPFITGKNFTFRIIVEIIFALWLILALRVPSVRPKKSALLFAIGAFVLSLGISTIFSENPSKSFWSNFERMEGYITILHLGAYFLVISTMLNAEKLWKRFLNTSIGVSVLLALFGVAQLLGFFVINQGGLRVDATFGNATYLAVYMLFHVFLTLYALSKWNSPKWIRLVYSIAVLLQIVIIFYTATRGTILGLIGGLFLSGLVLVFFNKGHGNIRKIGVGVLAAVILVVGSFFFIKDTSFVQNNPVLTRVASISLSAGQTRFTIWGMAWQGFLERPVFGWGQENFNYVFNEQYQPSLFGQEPWFDRVHNIFLDWLIAGGMLALGLYLSFFVIVLWYLWKPHNNFSVTDRALFTGLFAGYGFHNLFVFDNLMSYIMFFSVLALLLYRAQERGIDQHTIEEGPVQEKTLSKNTVTAGTAGVVIVLALVLYFANVPGMTRATGMIEALRPHQGGLSENFTAFQKVIVGGGLGRQEAHEQLLQFATQVRSPNLAHLGTDELRNEVTLFVRDAFAEEVARAPDDTRLLLFYGSFLRQIGDSVGAESVLNHARETAPQKQAVRFEQALLALGVGNQQGALALLKDAYELDTSYDQARILYATVAIGAGQNKLADQLLIERYNTVAPNDNTILQAYIDSGQTDRVVQIAQSRVEKEPTNFDFYLQLAGAHLNDNNRAEAVQALQTAIQLNPDFTEQGEFFISEIRAGRNP